MKKTILSLGLSLALITGIVGTVKANEVEYSQGLNKEVDAEIFLNGIKHFKDIPNYLEVSGLVVEANIQYAYSFKESVIVALMYKDNLYMRYEDFIDIIKPDKFDFVPDQPDDLLGPYFPEMEKYGKLITVLEGSNKLKINNKIINFNIPAPFTGYYRNNKTMFIPVRAVGEALGLKVIFSSLGNSYIVTIKGN